MPPNVKKMMEAAKPRSTEDHATRYLGRKRARTAFPHLFLRMRFMRWCDIRH